MRALRIAIALVPALAGCDAVFGLTTQPTDAGRDGVGSDARGVDAFGPPACGASVTRQAQVLALGAFPDGVDSYTRDEVGNSAFASGDAIYYTTASTGSGGAITNVTGASPKLSPDGDELVFMTVANLPDHMVWGTSPPNVTAPSYAPLVGLPQATNISSPTDPLYGPRHLIVYGDMSDQAAAPSGFEEWIETIDEADSRTWSAAHQSYGLDALTAAPTAIAIADPELSADGLRLVYTVRTASTTSDDAIYVSERPAIGATFPVGHIVVAPNANAFYSAPFATADCAKIFATDGAEIVELDTP